MFRNRIVLSLIVTMSFLVPGSLIAQERNAGTYPDIGVMTSVLRQLVKGIDGEDRAGAEVSGNYLPDYGLLFVVDYSSRGFRPDFMAGRIYNGDLFLDMRAFDSSMAVFDSTMAHFDIRMKHFDSAFTRNDTAFLPPVPRIKVHPPRIEMRGLIDNKPARLSKEGISRLDDQVIKFLGSYADAENKLKPAQHVSVVVLMGRDSQTRYYTVTRKQISDYRSQSESEAAFRQNVQMRDLVERHESVGIMETIFDKSLSHRLTDGERLIFGPNSSGFYLKGLGAFFICRLSGIDDFGYSGTSPNKKTDRIDELEKLMIRTLGDYGSTLRFMPADESIAVTLRLDMFGSENKEIMISVKKKDADAYSRNKISYDTFRQRAVVIASR